MEFMTHRLHFRARIRIAWVVLIAVAVSITGWGSYWIAADIVETNATQLNQDSIHKSKQMLDNNLRQITVSVMTLMISDAFKALMRDVSLGDESRYATHLSALQTSFAQIKLSEPMTQAILVSTPIGEFYNTGYARVASVPFVGSDIHRRLESEKGMLWTSGHRDPFFANHEQVISLAMEPITDFPVRDVYIVVNVSEETMRESLRTNLTGNGGELLLLTEDGREVLRSGGEAWDRLGGDAGFHTRLAESVSGHFSYAAAKEEYIVNYAKLELRFGWIVASVQKKAELFRQMDRIKWIVLGIAAACIAIALIVSQMLMVILMKPLNNLKTLMRKVEAHNLNVRYESKHADEFSLLGIRFNMMLEQVAKLIETVKAVEKEKRTAEMKALQAHISPHFLYNALNTIYFKCELGQNEDVGEMVLALSRMFQLGLNNGQALTTLDKELSHVRQYLTIQQRCYPGMFTHDIEVEDEALLQEPILKVMLQPLVENSIMHGFRHRREGGRIRIRVGRLERDMLVSVSDNGTGMNAAAVLAAATGPRREAGTGRLAAPEPSDGAVLAGETGSTGSYALSNIYDRLQLYYGNGSAMTIDSKPNEWTTVALRLPSRLED